MPDRTPAWTCEATYCVERLAESFSGPGTTLGHAVLPVPAGDTIQGWCTDGIELSLYIKYRVQSLKDEIRIADLGKTGNPAPTPKQLPPAPVPRHNKKIDKDLTCNSCGYFGKMTWTRGTTVFEKIVVFLLGVLLYGLLLSSYLLDVPKKLFHGLYQLI